VGVVEGLHHRSVEEQTGSVEGDFCSVVENSGSVSENSEENLEENWKEKSRNLAEKNLEEKSKNFLVNNRNRH
jgi:hypothetical protein